MAAFFRGWKRKVGVLMLVMAYAIAGLWVRSLSIMDRFQFFWNTSSFVYLNSLDGYLCCGYSYSNRSVYKPPPQFHWFTYPIEDGNAFADEFRDYEWKWRIELNGVAVSHEPPNHFLTVFLRHALVALILTGCSAWLILNKRRPARATDDLSMTRPARD